MNWMNGSLDKVQNKYKCSCGAESVHGVYDDENNHVGEFCDTCFGVYLINQDAGHDLDISTSTYKELYNSVAQKLNAANHLLSDISQMLVHGREGGRTLLAPDGAKSPASEELTEKEFQALARWWG